MLYIVGFGPGGYETATVEVVRALEDSDSIVGYTTYVDLIRPWFPEKRISTAGEAGKRSGVFLPSKRKRTAERWRWYAAVTAEFTAWQAWYMNWQPGTKRR